MVMIEDLKGYKALLIDDDEFVRDSMQFFFNGKGWQIYSLPTAEEGLDLLESEVFNVIFCDFLLPGMNGIEFFKKIEQTHPEPVKILISSYASFDMAVDAWKAGVDDYIKKPFSPASFEKSLSFLVKKGRIDPDPLFQDRCKDTANGSR